jgi:hypothetical protein
VPLDPEDVRRRVTERVSAWDDGDVAVRVEPGRYDAVHVTVSSRHPHTYYTQWVDLRPDGTVELPAPDDGFTSVGAKGTAVGTVTSADEAVDVVVREVEAAVTSLRKLQAQHQAWHRPSTQPPVADADLAEACTMWQGGRNIGSSLVRGAARALTGIPHYFGADFIRAYEQKARKTPQALAAATTLLRAVNGAERRDADGWNAMTGLPARGLAGRGLEANPEKDDQILRVLEHGRITMPLWGVSLDRKVAEKFGTRFVLEVVGDFPAVPAWRASGIKDDEQELITGGEYRVLSLTEDGGTTHATLEWIGAAGDKVGSDDVLLGVLGAVDGLWKSDLTHPFGTLEKLTLHLPGDGNWATVERRQGEPQATVQRYYTPEPDPDAKDDSEWTQYAAMLKASRQMTVPADVESIVAAVLTER